MVDMTEEDAGRETFHIYILSFAYGILLVVIAGHLVWRWQWRRIGLKRFKSHAPGDKSFKCKAMRQRLFNDFAPIQDLISDPRLISKELDPQQFGECQGSDLPTHWYRMKTFDAAANFVSTNCSLLQSHTPQSQSPPLPLPQFLSQLQQQEGARLFEGTESSRFSTSEESGQNVVGKCCQFYNVARYNDGAFGKDKFEEFTSLLTQLQQLISISLRSSHTRSSGQSSKPVSISHISPIPLQSMGRVPSYEAGVPLGYSYQSSVMSSEDFIVSGYASGDPLLLEQFSLIKHYPPSASHDPKKRTTSPRQTIDAPPTASPRSSGRSKKPPALELSPLIVSGGREGVDSDNEISPPIGSSKSQSSYIMSETPV